MGPPLPKITIDGPFDQSDRSTGPVTALYLTEEARDSAETDANRQSIPLQDDDEALLASLTGRRSVDYNGVGNAQRLYEADLGDDMEEALLEQLFRLESLVLAEQGQGYRVSDNVRHEVYNPGEDTPGVLFDEVSWEQESGQPNRFEWRLSGQVSEGMQDATSRGRYVADQFTRQVPVLEDELVSEDVVLSLGDVRSRRYERTIELDTMDMVHQFDVPNVGIAESGVEGTFSIDGRLTEEDVDDLAEAATQITDDVHGRQSTIRDAFTSREFRGSVTDSSTTFEAGVPDVLDYRIELMIGDEVMEEV